MTEPAADVPEPQVHAVVVPAGASILDAATWIGRACWTELRFHALLTSWLADEGDADLALDLWSLRSGHAELAEAWHRRLPELRELPRAGFVEPGGTDEEAFAALDALVGPGTSSRRAAALRTALVAHLARYEDHRAVAVGPADGPAAATLAVATATTASGVDRLDRWLAAR